jgi:hypothetical protein
LDELATQTQALADRMDRIGALAEQALFGLADLRQRLAAPAPRKPPREDGIFMWSWRHPRKALRGALISIRAGLRMQGMGLNK